MSLINPLSYEAPFQEIPIVQHTIWTIDMFELPPPPLMETTNWFVIQQTYDENDENYENDENIQADHFVKSILTSVSSQMSNMSSARSFDSNSQNVVVRNKPDDSGFARFPMKLWRIVNECETGSITWSETGKSIIIKYSQFQKEYLNGSSKYFKTLNICSFIRQLNLYGFKKLAKKSKKYSSKPNVLIEVSNVQWNNLTTKRCLFVETKHEFFNDLFMKDHPDLLPLINRKLPQATRTLFTHTNKKFRTKK